MDEETANRDNQRANADAVDAALRQWTSSELLDGHCEAIIEHAGEFYRLRCTRNNKLILTK